MVGSRTSSKRDFRHVQFVRHRPPDCDPVRWCVHYRIAVRFGRDLGPDRLTQLLNKEHPMNGRFLVNRRDAKVMGVAAGLADYTGFDPTMVRVGIVALTLLTGPMMIFL